MLVRFQGLGGLGFGIASLEFLSPSSVFPQARDTPNSRVCQGSAALEEAQAGGASGTTLKP